MRYPLLLLLFCCFACTPKTSSAFQEEAPDAKIGEESDLPNISGTWALTFETRQGERTNELTIVQEGKTATATGERGKVKMQVVKDKISWSNTRYIPRGEVTINFNGKILDEENMKGTMSASRGQGAGRTLNWTAVRVK